MFVDVFVTKTFVADLCLDADGNPISTGPFEKPGDCDNFYQVSTCYC